MVKIELKIAFIFLLTLFCLLFHLFLLPFTEPGLLPVSLPVYFPPPFSPLFTYYFSVPPSKKGKGGSCPFVLPLFTYNPFIRIKGLLYPLTPFYVLPPEGGLAPFIPFTPPTGGYEGEGPTGG
jgi:hypothetical protein